MLFIYDSGYLYRYIDKKELCFILKNGIVYSTNNPNGTYWTTLLTDDPSRASNFLAISKKELFRIGGFRLADVDPRHIKYSGIVKPAKGFSGGAIEILIDIPIPIITIYDIIGKRLIGSYMDGSFAAIRRLSCY
ncbi:hypothetical protein SULI_13015 [Saccharolobus solfataricus]|uniref:Uncharacterized protein n=2 Tax=Saccharolobus solfataricus TaxID=2287 RepID=A0A0E3MF88_SACSO|nr:hypothetical protein [Saccharolobus solfataricus]AKA74681.1 hypothetical protein SULB_2565 [Saccharolobus solfataricus]AKA77375.1 hypothetical protein SULC_2560 [Saccharolobus solfataricus]AKA80066.1 hypothetical protein SULA_2563 [Saccharolobus solfataricus]AZF69145.1 hypothetical protein SULG_13015 [Saccharolobus solfataricus]AZF71765.1 hypothetical protein SULH_13015 [Saccharolobus solfataricus]